MKSPGADFEEFEEESVVDDDLPEISCTVSVKSCLSTVFGPTSGTW